MSRIRSLARRLATTVFAVAALGAVVAASSHADIHSAWVNAANAESKRECNRIASIIVKGVPIVIYTCRAPSSRCDQAHPPYSLGIGDCHSVWSMQKRSTGKDYVCEYHTMWYRDGRLYKKWPSYCYPLGVVKTSAKNVRAAAVCATASCRQSTALTIVKGMCRGKFPNTCQAPFLHNPGAVVALYGYVRAGYWTYFGHFTGYAGTRRIACEVYANVKNDNSGGFSSGLYCA
jgi:hypothetical protein